MKTADLTGYWKITKMDEWGQDYVDLVVPGFIEFEMEDDHCSGVFSLGLCLDRSTVDFVIPAQGSSSNGHGKGELTPTLAAVAAGRNWKARS